MTTRKKSYCSVLCFDVGFTGVEHRFFGDIYCVVQNLAAKPLKNVHETLVNCTMINDYKSHCKYIREKEKLTDG